MTDAQPDDKTTFRVRYTTPGFTGEVDFDTESGARAYLETLEKWTRATIIKMIVIDDIEGETQ